MRLFVSLFVPLLLVISSLIGCRSTNSISDFHEQIAVDSCDSLAAQSLTETAVEEVRDNHIVRDDSMIMDFVVYSPPDSSGRQFVRSKGRIHRGQRVQQHDQMLHNEKNTSSTNTTKLTQQSRQREIQDKKEDSKSSHAIYWKFGLAMLALVIALIITIRRLWQLL